MARANVCGFTEAIDKIASVRSVVSPIEFFLHQLEIFERCNFDLNPTKYPEYRRFLMNYDAQDMLGKPTRVYQESDAESLYRRVWR